MPKSITSPAPGRACTFRTDPDVWKDLKQTATELGRPWGLTSTINYAIRYGLPIFRKSQGLTSVNHGTKKVA